MNPALSHHIIQGLRAMSVEKADQTLCGMHSDDLIALGDVLGLRLPTIGGDKPACIIGALQRTTPTRAV